MSRRDDRLIQSITAYKCRICKKYHNEDLLDKSEENLNPLDLRTYLEKFFDYIKKYKIDIYTGKTLLLDQPSDFKELDDSVIRLHIQPKAGKAREDFSVVNCQTDEIHKFRGELYSAIYGYHVFFYLKENENIFIFHRYGKSGCKTVFLSLFNEFLKKEGLVAHLDVQMSNTLFDEASNHEVEKIHLIKTYNVESSDKADNIGNKSKKKIESETILSLDAPRARFIQRWLTQLKHQPSVNELRSVLIKNDYNCRDDFQVAKVTVKLGNITRKISLEEFSGMIAEYDITDKIQLNEDGSIKVDSLYEEADKYALQLLNER